MKVRIYEYPMLSGAEHLHSAEPVERGYIEMDKFDENECFHICNWWHWTTTKPECLHSDIESCQHGIVFVNPENDVHCLALSSDWLYGKANHIQNYVNSHLDTAVWLHDETNPYKEEKREIIPYRVYHHFKGKRYIVLDIAEHSETSEKYVVYKALYGEYKTYVRPYDMFASEVDHVKYPEVHQKYRFELVENVTL